MWQKIQSLPISFLLTRASSGSGEVAGGSRDPRWFRICFLKFPLILLLFFSSERAQCGEWNPGRRCTKFSDLWAGGRW